MAHIIHNTGANAVKNRQSTVVGDGMFARVFCNVFILSSCGIDQRVTIKIKRDGIARGNGNIRGHIFQQGHGSIISCRNSLGKGLVVGIADLGHGVRLAQRLNGLGLAIVGVAISNIGGHITGEGAAGDLNIVGFRIISRIGRIGRIKIQALGRSHVKVLIANLALGAASTGERTAIDLHLSGTGNNANAVIDGELAAIHGYNILPRRINAAGNIAGGLNITGELAAVDGNGISLFALLPVMISAISVTRDHCIIGGLKNTILNRDLSAGSIASNDCTFYRFDVGIFNRCG